ncbi:hypothetical protein H696_03576 [Fonticula alba]|uniref:Clp1 P-loop domain-containing protein n=1 Tax=Fonticula alba TaxID=691883 RepID=A0A058Z871_FONAL|nr:hypothetical protein H696_03576 [Fonticula alba]KCV70113.1 hypothetical protein H696_03576 [Fonticula alba]|eukprot:XP_009495719.1 hypothetical protein H696_03576 [Fonticula alba]
MTRPRSLSSAGRPMPTKHPRLGPAASAPPAPSPAVPSRETLRHLPLPVTVSVVPGPFRPTAANSWTSPCGRFSIIGMRAMETLSFLGAARVRVIHGQVECQGAVLDRTHAAGPRLPSLPPLASPLAATDATHLGVGVYSPASHALASLQALPCPATVGDAVRLKLLPTPGPGSFVSGPDGAGAPTSLRYVPPAGVSLTRVRTGLLRQLLQESLDAFPGELAASLETMGPAFGVDPGEVQATVQAIVERVRSFDAWDSLVLLSVADLAPFACLQAIQGLQNLFGTAPGSGAPGDSSPGDWPAGGPFPASPSWGVGPGPAAGVDPSLLLGGVNFTPEYLLQNMGPELGDDRVAGSAGGSPPGFLHGGSSSGPGASSMASGSPSSEGLNDWSAGESGVGGPAPGFLVARFDDWQSALDTVADELCQYRHAIWHAHATELARARGPADFRHFPGPQGVDGDAAADAAATWPPFETFAPMAWQITEHIGLPPVYLFAGPKNTGKSTLGRWLTNRLLSLGHPVAVLDTDVGQPEYTAPGLISLTVPRSFSLGPPFTHLTEPEFSCFYGALSPNSDPEGFLAACTRAVAHYNEHLAPLGVPLVVNTCGWVRGTGLDLLSGLVAMLNPTRVYAMGTPGRLTRRDLPADFGRNGFAGGAIAPEIAWLTPNDAALVAQGGRLTPREQAAMLKHGPNDHRAMTLMTYLYAGNLLASSGAPAGWPATERRSFLPLARAPGARDACARPLVLRTPRSAGWEAVCVSLEGPADELLARLGSDAPGIEAATCGELLRALNVQLVGLVASAAASGVLEAGRPATIIAAEAPPGRSLDAPFFVRGAQGPSLDGECLGLALVRAVNPTQRDFQLVTTEPIWRLQGGPVPGRIAGRGSCQVGGTPRPSANVLAWRPQGGLDLPVAALSHGSSLVGAPLYATSIFADSLALGGANRRARHNLQRRSNVPGGGR